MAAQFITWKETDNQDLAVENGSFVLLEDQEAVVQQVGTTLRNAKRDNFVDLDEGLNYLDGERGILGTSALSLENETEIIEKINNSFGVANLLKFTAEFTSKTKLIISATITTIFSEEPVTVSIAA